MAKAEKRNDPALSNMLAWLMADIADIEIIAKLAIRGEYVGTEDEEDDIEE